MATGPPWFLTSAKTVPSPARACSGLRNTAEPTASGLEMWLKPKTRLGDQLRYASEWGIPFAVIMGEDECNKGEVTVKDLEAGAKAPEDITDREQWVSERPGQFTIARSELLARLRELIGR